MRNGDDTIMVGDLKARNITWDIVSNGRGTAVLHFSKRRNYNITPPKNPSFFAKGKKGWSKRDLILYKAKVQVEHPSDS